MKRVVVALSCILLILAVGGCTNKPLDTNSAGQDFSYVLNSAGMDRAEYISEVEQILNDDLDHFTRADYLLILGRLTNDQNKILMAMDYYHRALEYADDLEEKAILYETIAAIEAPGLAKRYYFLRAYDAWKRLGVKWRSKIDFSLALGRSYAWQYDLKDLETMPLDAEGKSAIIIGKSTFSLDKSDLLVTQADRVSRDWLSLQLQKPYAEAHLTVFSERLNFLPEELQREIGWHEGARSLEVQSFGIKHKIASGTIVKKFEGKWYAPNENGIFMFEVLPDKIAYPTTRFLRDDIAMVVDTHGLNSIVEQAIRYNATAVMACCDCVGKIRAAKYLSDKGIKVICNTDKYLPLLLGSGANVLGSAAFRIDGDKLVFGNRPVEISLKEPVIVVDPVTHEQGMGYYDTPARYFAELDKRGVKMNVFYVEIDSFGQMDRVIRKAKMAHANVIAVRIFNSDDYAKAKAWLEENPDRKVILFHSEAYPFGYRLAREFRSQTTFDDINPVFI